MPRQRKLRADLDTNGVILNESGIEIGRMTLNDNLILDPIALYVEIERKAAENYGKVKKTHLYMKFGRYGTWAYDPAVDAILADFHHDGFIDYPKDGVIKPIATLRKVAKHYPPYVTRAQVLAGLEPLEDAE